MIDVDWVSHLSAILVGGLAHAARGSLLRVQSAARKAACCTKEPLYMSYVGSAEVVVEKRVITYSVRVV